MADCCASDLGLILSQLCKIYDSFIWLNKSYLTRIMEKLKCLFDETGTTPNLEEKVKKKFSKYKIPWCKQTSHNN